MTKHRATSTGTSGMGADDAITFDPAITESEHAPNSLYNWGQWGDTAADSLWFGQFATELDFFDQGLAAESNISFM